MPGPGSGTGTPAALRSTVAREAAVVVALTVLVAVASAAADLPGRIAQWSRSTVGPLDDAVLLLAVSHVFMLVFGSRRARDLKAQSARREQAERELRERARTDPLTGLLNRAGLAEELGAAVGPAAAGGSRPAVVLLDLDRFKEVNDTLGHAVGDALLRAVAGRLTAELRSDDVLARLGGDEFVVLLRDADPDAVRHATDRLLAALRRPFDVDGMVLEVDGSLGVATAGTDAAELLRAADVAMYAAKADRSGVVVHTPALDRHGPARLGQFGDLRRGIRDGELQVHYQPRATLADGRVVGVAALVRWAHPQRGLLPRSEFIGLAEATGLVRTLTDVVLARALADCRDWRAAGRELTVAVDLSARVLLDPTLPRRVAALLAEHGLPAGCLELTVTGSAGVPDPAQALDVLRQLRGLGVTLSVGDDGTGHASLSSLSRLPVGTLRIDRSSTTTMDVDGTAHVIVRSTIELAHALGLRVVAEGVETARTWQRLRALGCDEAQGSWLARPAPAADVLAQVAAAESRTGVPARSG
ncbi:EAL domain-containing protein [Geodermatophilus sp. DSM 44513]|uniref:putative bifunctional diguanylate cyclase/phosphodiesterase n=1 Tax=Geodermatophilus sp. DSM 44513 TaxID=1528104 RepID=UPI0028F6EE40|nr:EAL domain-containing protein [Geodermatophilus sp. DSM 44513]WNV75141.1 EAL domain-containing protein [Geodermatophilus sp. DSM 44513]